MADLTDASPPRPSRYRTQRRVTHSSDDAPNLEPTPEVPGDAELARSKSRYHRKASNASRPTTSSASRPTTSARPVTRDQPPIADLPARYHTKAAQDPPKPIYQAHVVQAQQPRPRVPTTTAKEDARPVVAETTLSPRIPLTRINSGDELDSGVEFERRERSYSKSASKRRPDTATATAAPPIAHDYLATSPPLPKPPLTGELFPPPRPLNAPITGHGPPRSDQIRATKSMNELNHHSSSPMSGCLSMFKRKKADEPIPAVPAIPNLNKTMISRPMTAKDDSQAIKMNGKGIVPGTDAPVSAVNAGDRRVLIECGRARNIFPVTPTTTSLDLIKSAATIMSEPIDVKSAVLLEYFSKVGIQRPLRRYERVRDVMNSWDHDRENTLILVDPKTGTSEAELSLAGVPQSRPEDMGWTMLFSQKPGKWEKRYITLKSDGQVAFQKDADKPKDIANLCHLSDFDVYTPTAEKAKKKIKPPKKYCFAIKSQQKTSMFESTQDFVHFFSTSDKAIADSFYQTIQSWRSWYLVNVLGEGYKTQNTQTTSAEPKRQLTTKNRSASNAPIQHAHRRNESTASHYQLGSFKPLIDMDMFSNTVPEEQAPPVQPTPPATGFHKSANQFDVNVSPERRAAGTKSRHPPITIQNKAVLRDDEPLANLNRKASVDKRTSFDRNRRESEEFRANGLLGRKYSLLQKESAERATQESQPFTAGPSLLNGGVAASTENRSAALAGDGVRRNRSLRDSNTNANQPRRSSSIRDTKNSTDLRRSDSRARDPLSKPLVDLTPQYREPPQHAKKGRGYHPDAVGPNGLVDSATSPDDPLNIPPSTDWRNRSRADSSAAKKLHVNTANASNLIENATSPLDDTFESAAAAAAAANTNLRSNARRPTITARTAPVLEPFTGEGLLAAAQAKQGWGDGSKGRGVMDGSHANGPMLNLSLDNTFVQGSLLNRVEREQGMQGPIIDREKRVERLEKTGEGF